MKLKCKVPTSWKLWFAWHPVMLQDTGEYVWLKRVWRMHNTTSQSIEYEAWYGEARELAANRAPYKEEDRIKAAQAIQQGFEDAKAKRQIEKMARQVELERLMQKNGI